MVIFSVFPLTWASIWSPDSRRIAYGANFTADSLNHIFVRPSSGAGGRVEVMTSDDLLTVITSWTA